jgi:hypothetical protein
MALALSYGTQSARVGARSAQDAAPQAAAPPDDRALVTKYCAPCHSARVHAGSLVLDDLDPAHAADAADIWEKVAHKLRAGAMPPAGRPRPDRSDALAFVGRLESSLDAAALARPARGPAAVRRLSRAEYGNAVHDLLAADVDVRTLLPPDDQNHGFENIADALSMSPTLLERYLSAARRVAQLAVGDPETRPVMQSFAVPNSLVQDDWMGEDLPFGSRGGYAVRYWFPLDGEYLVRVRLRREVYGYIRGLGRPHTLDIRLDGARVRTFTVGRRWDKGVAPPASYAGNTIATPEWEDYTQHADEGLEVRFTARAGVHAVSVSFDSDGMIPEGVLGPQVDMTAFSYSSDEMQDGNPAVASLVIGGPFTPAGAGETPSRRRIFICHPETERADDQARCAEKIVSTLARRAFRRSVTGDDVQSLLSFYESGRQDGGFEAGIRAVLERVLADPEFLFRVERPSRTPSQAQHSDDLALASRLSFFLWSSIPDDELMDVAARGALKDRAVLQRQVRRMLADPRSSRFVENSLAQWLQVRSIRNVVPDTATFPEFDENLRESMLEETKLFLASQLREDRGVIDLVEANYTFVNERLARHYGVPNVYGQEFRRVTFNDGSRGGLLGQGSILTVTSYANRTSPVLRGKWLLENVLGTPPPPPPANVPSLKDDRQDGQVKSVRERLEQHRKNPVCATCHSVIDPLGFALENFDGIGRWRTRNEGSTPYIAGLPIDTSGQMADGTKLDGPTGLRRMLLDRKEQFVETVVEKVLTSALGREVVPSDMPAVRKIMRGAAPSDYHWSSVVLNIVESVPFQLGSAQ